MGHGKKAVHFPVFHFRPFDNTIDPVVTVSLCMSLQYSTWPCAVNRVKH